MPAVFVPNHFRLDRALVAVLKGSHVTPALFKAVCNMLGSGIFLPAASFPMVMSWIRSKHNSCGSGEQVERLRDECRLLHNTPNMRNLRCSVHGRRVVLY
jgi:hypothetical protein